MLWRVSDYISEHLTNIDNVLICKLLSAASETVSMSITIVVGIAGVATANIRSVRLALALVEHFDVGKQALLLLSQKNAKDKETGRGRGKAGWQVLYPQPASGESDYVMMSTLAVALLPSIACHARTAPTCSPSEASRCTV